MRDVEGPPRLLIVGAICAGKSTAMRRICALRGRSITIDCKGAGLPCICGARPCLCAPQVTTSDRRELAAEIRKRAAGPMDIVYHPWGPDGGPWATNDEWWGVMRPILDAIEQAAEKGGWVTLCIDEMRVFSPHVFGRAWQRMNQRLAVCRRGAARGRGGFSTILTAQSVRDIPPGVRGLFTHLLLRPVGIDDADYMKGRWGMKDSHAIVKEASELEGEMGRWLQVDLITGKRRVITI